MIIRKLLGKGVDNGMLGACHICLSVEQEAILAALIDHIRDLGLHLHIAKLTNLVSHILVFHNVNPRLIGHLYTHELLLARIPARHHVRGNDSSIHLNPFHGFNRAMVIVIVSLIKPDIEQARAGILNSLVVHHDVCLGAAASLLAREEGSLVAREQVRSHLLRCCEVHRPPRSDEASDVRHGTEEIAFHGALIDHLANLA
mmetsp:Transcript_7994/g.17824  ORF Transcript_7994/g.17824 Transcript_7994/m.17824 type:complete len:201 (+) Transcript_7994:61-663(+)